MSSKSGDRDEQSSTLCDPETQRAIQQIIKEEIEIQKKRNAA
jgi:hypothetical protein